MNSRLQARCQSPWWLFFVFWYLNEQSRHGYFRAGNCVGGVHAALRAGGGGSFKPSAILLCELAELVAMRFASRLDPLNKESVHLKWQDVARDGSWRCAVGPVCGRIMATGVFGEQAIPCRIYLSAGNLAGRDSVYGSFHFYPVMRFAGAVAFPDFGVFAGLVAVLMGAGQMRLPSSTRCETGAGFLWPIRDAAGHRHGDGTVRNERNAVQKTHCVSTLGVDPRSVLMRLRRSGPLQTFVERFGSALPFAPRRLFRLGARVARHLPSVQEVLRRRFLKKLQTEDAWLATNRRPAYRSVVASRLSGILTEWKNRSGACWEGLRRIRFVRNGKRLLGPCAEVQPVERWRNFGGCCCFRTRSGMFGSSNLRLLTGLSLQIARARNYVVDARSAARTRIRTAHLDWAGVSSHRHQDEVLRTVQVELGQISNHQHVLHAFQEEDEIRLSWRSKVACFSQALTGVSNGFTSISSKPENRC